MRIFSLSLNTWACISLRQISIALMFVLQFVLVSAWAQSDSLFRAKRILERISSTKVAIDDPLLVQMVPLVESGNLQAAAEIATRHPNFLNITVKHMALQMSTREETRRIPLNDFSAAIVGVVRDELDARQILMGNFYYRANNTLIPTGINVRGDLLNDILRSNNHFQDLEQMGIDLGAVLVRVDGQVLANAQNQIVTNPEPAGVLTSRAFMGAHIVAGTGRRPVEFTFREFLCVPIEEWADSSVTDAFIGRDIDRFPGNDHSKFLTSCKSCHTGMDGFRGAFARWDFQNNRILNASAETNRPGAFDNNLVSNKFNQNSEVFPGGYVTTNNSFYNNARGPANAQVFEWRGSVDSGQGVRDFAVMVANSKRFSQCMVKRVYDAVCRTQISAKANMPFLKEHADLLEGESYNLKKLAQRIAVLPRCLGEE